MYFPAQLYELTAKGLAGGLLELWTQKLLLNVANSSIQLFSSFVPADRVLFLYHAAFVASCGAGQSFLRAYLQERDPQGNVSAFIQGGSADIGTAGAVDDFLKYKHEPMFVVKPGHRIEGTALFSAGAVANQAQWGLQGWLVPRSAIQFNG